MGARSIGNHRFIRPPTPNIAQLKGIDRATIDVPIMWGLLMSGRENEMRLALWNPASRGQEKVTLFLTA